MKMCENIILWHRIYVLRKAGKQTAYLFAVTRFRHFINSLRCVICAWHFPSHQTHKLTHTHTHTHYIRLLCPQPNSMSVILYQKHFMYFQLWVFWLSLYVWGLVLTLLIVTLLLGTGADTFDCHFTSVDWCWHFWLSLYFWGLVLTLLIVTLFLGSSADTFDCHFTSVDRCWHFSNLTIIFNVFSFFILFPWRWPHVCPKHAAGLSLSLSLYIYIYIGRVFQYNRVHFVDTVTIWNWLVHELCIT
jgi:hypothetical protein